METRSLLARYLLENKALINQNIEKKLDQDQVGLVSRIFNDMPHITGQLRNELILPLARIVINSIEEVEKVKKQVDMDSLSAETEEDNQKMRVLKGEGPEMDSWIDYLIYFAFDQIFAANGEIKDDIFKILDVNGQLSVLKPQTKNTKEKEQWEQIKAIIASTFIANVLCADIPKLLEELGYTNAKDLFISTPITTQINKKVQTSSDYGIQEIKEKALNGAQKSIIIKRYLAEDYSLLGDLKVKSILKKNIEQNKLTDPNINIFSLWFNDISTVGYPEFVDLRNTIQTALLKNELGSWLSLAFCVAVNDLFDSNGDIKNSIVDKFSKDLIDEVEQRLGKDNLKRQLLSAYFELITRSIFSEVMSSQMMVEKGFDVIIKFKENYETASNKIFDGVKKDIINKDFIEKNKIDFESKSSAFNLKIRSAEAASLTEEIKLNPLSDNDLKTVFTFLNQADQELQFYYFKIYELNLRYPKILRLLEHIIINPNSLNIIQYKKICTEIGKSLNDNSFISLSEKFIDACQFYQTKLKLSKSLQFDEDYNKLTQEVNAFLAKMEEIEKKCFLIRIPDNELNAGNILKSLPAFSRSAYVITYDKKNKEKLFYFDLDEKDGNIITKVDLPDNKIAGRDLYILSGELPENLKELNIQNQAYIITNTVITRINTYASTPIKINESDLLTALNSLPTKNISVVTRWGIFKKVEDKSKGIVSISRMNQDNQFEKIISYIPYSYSTDNIEQVLLKMEKDKTGTTQKIKMITPEGLFEIEYNAKTQEEKIKNITEDLISEGFSNSYVMIDKKLYYITVTNDLMFSIREVNNYDEIESLKFDMIFESLKHEEGTLTKVEKTQSLPQLRQLNALLPQDVPVLDRATPTLVNIDGVKEDTSILGGYLGRDTVHELSSPELTKIGEQHKRQAHSDSYDSQGTIKLAESPLKGIEYHFNLFKQLLHKQVQLTNKLSELYLMSNLPMNPDEIQKLKIKNCFVITTKNQLYYIDADFNPHQLMIASDSIKEILSSLENMNASGIPLPIKNKISKNELDNLNKIITRNPPQVLKELMYMTMNEMVHPSTITRGIYLTNINKLENPELLATAQALIDSCFAYNEHQLTEFNRDIESTQQQILHFIKEHEVNKFDKIETILSTSVKDKTEYRSLALQLISKDIFDSYTESKHLFNLKTGLSKEMILEIWKIMLNPDEQAISQLMDNPSIRKLHEQEKRKLSFLLKSCREYLKVEAIINEKETLLAAQKTKAKIHDEPRDSAVATQTDKKLGKEEEGAVKLPKKEKQTKEPTYAYGEVETIGKLPTYVYKEKPADKLIIVDKYKFLKIDLHLAELLIKEHFKTYVEKKQVHFMPIKKEHIFSSEEFSNNTLFQEVINNYLKNYNSTLLSEEEEPLSFEDIQGIEYDPLALELFNKFEVFQKQVQEYKLFQKQVQAYKLQEYKSLREKELAQQPPLPEIKFTNEIIADLDVTQKGITEKISNLLHKKEKTDVLEGYTADEEKYTEPDEDYFIPDEIYAIPLSDQITTLPTKSHEKKHTQQIEDNETKANAFIDKLIKFPKTSDHYGELFASGILFNTDNIKIYYSIIKLIQEIIMDPFNSKLLIQCNQALDELQKHEMNVSGKARFKKLVFETIQSSQTEEIGLPQYVSNPEKDDPLTITKNDFLFSYAKLCMELNPVKILTINPEAYIKFCQLMDSTLETALQNPFNATQFRQNLSKQYSEFEKLDGMSNSLKVSTLNYQNFEDIVEKGKIVWLLADKQIYENYVSLFPTGKNVAADIINETHSLMKNPFNTKQSSIIQKIVEQYDKKIHLKIQNLLKELLVQCAYKLITQNLENIANKQYQVHEHKENDIENQKEYYEFLIDNFFVKKSILSISNLVFDNLQNTAWWYQNQYLIEFMMLDPNGPNNKYQKLYDQSLTALSPNSPLKKQIEILIAECSFVQAENRLKKAVWYNTYHLIEQPAKAIYDEIRDIKSKTTDLNELMNIVKIMQATADILKDPKSVSVEVLSNYRDCLKLTNNNNLLKAINLIGTKVENYNNILMTTLDKLNSANEKCAIQAIANAANTFSTEIKTAKSATTDSNEIMNLITIIQATKDFKEIMNLITVMQETTRILENPKIDQEALTNYLKLSKNKLVKPVMKQFALAVANHNNLELPGIKTKLKSMLPKTHLPKISNTEEDQIQQGQPEQHKEVGTTEEQRPSQSSSQDLSQGEEIKEEEEEEVKIKEKEEEVEIKKESEKILQPSLGGSNSSLFSPLQIKSQQPQTTTSAPKESTGISSSPSFYQQSSPPGSPTKTKAVKEKKKPVIIPGKGKKTTFEGEEPEK